MWNVQTIGKNLIAELMKRIPPPPPVPIENPPNFDKLADRVAQHDPKIYVRKLGPVELKDWIREIGKIFDVVQVLDEKKMKIRTFYLVGEVNIWRSTIKDKLQGPKLI